MNEILERMQKDFNDFIQKADELVAQYKKPEVKKSDIGCLGYFWDLFTEDKVLDVLDGVDKDSVYKYVSKDGFGYKHYRRLTPSEVAEITGYKVEEE